MPKQKKDIFSAGAPAITYLQNKQKWTITKKADVGSDGIAIYSAYKDSTLVNKGYIYSYNSSAPTFQGDRIKIINEDSGHINGVFGIRILAAGGVDASVVNHGKIFGFNAAVVSQGPGAFRAENHGEMYGYAAAMVVEGVNAGTKAGPVIENHGSMKSDFVGLQVSVAPGLRTKIVNGEDGMIKGSGFLDPMQGAAIYNVTGKMVLTNKGTIKGDIVSLSPVATDKVINKGKLNGEAYLGPLDDEFNNKNGKAGKLHGEEGNDTFKLGSAKDEIVFDTTLNPITNVDRVKGFESGKDKFFLDQAIFGAVPGPGKLPGSAFQKGVSANDASDRIIYQKGTGELYYDPNGNVPGGQTLFAKLDPGTKLHASDFVVFA